MFVFAITQASGNFGGAGSIFEELADERLQMLDSPVPHQTQHPTTNTHVTNGSVYSTSGHQQIVRLATAAPPAPSQARQGGGHTFYPTAIHANYAIAPAAAAGSATATSLKARTQQTLVVTRQEGPQKVFTVGNATLSS